LTINEHFRLLRVVHGKINLDPLYQGLEQYFQNIINTQAAYLPQSVNPIPFVQEICIFTWRLMTNNEVSLIVFNQALFSVSSKTLLRVKISTRNLSQES